MTTNASNPMTTNLSECPIGSDVSCFHMPEDYYETGLRLIKAERAAFRKYLADKTEATALAHRRASRRLTEHENGHSTH